MDQYLLISLLERVVPFGKHQGRMLGDVPTKYLDSEVVKWERTLFVRQCEQAMDMVWRATQEARAWRDLNNHELMPSSSTLFEIHKTLQREEAKASCLPGTVKQAPLHPNDRQFAFMLLVRNGMEERQLRKEFYALLDGVDVGAKTKAFYRAKKAAVDAGHIAVVQGIVIDVRPTPL